MKHLRNLLAILIICSLSAHCFGQNEVLKYIQRNTGDYEIPFNINSPEPYGFAGVKVEFRDKGKRINCTFYQQDSQSDSNYKLMNYCYYTLAKIDKNSNMAIYHVDDMHKAENSSYAIIRLSLDRKRLYRQFAFINNGKMEVIGDLNNLDNYELLDTGLPTWMKYSPNAVFEYQNKTLDSDWRKVTFKNNGNEINITDYSKSYSGDKVINETTLQFVKFLPSENMLLYVSHIMSGYNRAIFISLDRKIIYNGSATFDSYKYLKSYEIYKKNEIETFEYKSSSPYEEELPSWMN
ncbi:MAG: hypothetical protein J6J37_00295 [Bacteroidaceae bacterium]|nr:hypothetical protein [Bacteroidaceae bacterium]